MINIYIYKISPTIEKLQCDICYELKNDWISINKCNHKMCYECYNKIINNSFNNINYVCEYYRDLYMINNSYITCPFCRTSFSFIDTTHNVKSKLSKTVKDAANCSYLNKKNIKSI